MEDLSTESAIRDKIREFRTAKSALYSKYYELKRKTEEEAGGFLNLSSEQRREIDEGFKVRKKQEEAEIENQIKILEEKLRGSILTEGKPEPTPAEPTPTEPTPTEPTPTEPTPAEPTPGEPPLAVEDTVIKAEPLEPKATETSTEEATAAFSPITLTSIDTGKARTLRASLEASQSWLKEFSGEESDYASSPQFGIVRDEADKWIITRATPKNPTYLNGEELLQDSVSLKSGDIISIGSKDENLGKMRLEITIE